jgi:hypothetical protein
VHATMSVASLRKIIKLIDARDPNFREIRE